MTQTDSLFDNENISELPEVDPEKDYLPELVGEDKKFKTPADLARSKMEADRFILQLQEEAKGLRTELKSRKAMEDLIDRLENPPPSQQQQETSPDAKGTTATTDLDLSERLDQLLSQREERRVRQGNLDTVHQKLSEVYGRQYKQVIKQKAQELEIGEQFLDDLAARSPNALFSLLQVENEQRPVTDFTPPPRTQRLASFKPETTKKTMSWYQKQYKGPSAYWPPAVQAQMHKDAYALGDAFFDN